jgi:ABC-2 type transport system ATP-binding protein
MAFDTQEMNSPHPSTIPAIEFSMVSKSFGKTPILCGVELKVTAGAIVGLAGVNGAGKTTLIKCLLDFCHMDSGQINIFGLPHRTHHSRARLTFLPERFTPPYYLTGREFLRTMHAFSETPYNETEALAVFRGIDLSEEVLEKPSRSLSKGMTQKLGLAACLMSGRDLYVLDEPLSGLDPQARSRVRGLFQELRDQGKTILFTSHSLADIEEICDHMLVLHRGKIDFSGAPRDLCVRHKESILERAFLRCIESNG